MPSCVRENHEIDLSTVDFDYITHHEQPTISLKPDSPVVLEPMKESGTGTVRESEMVALDKVIAQINELFSGDHPDSSVRNVRHPHQGPFGRKRDPATTRPEQLA